MIKLFNEALNSRFETLERNIKSKSNSFYDSYLDLLEETIKYFLIENNITFDETRTCGYIIKTIEVKDFFFNKLKLDDYTYNKLPDYIKKCNDHKHKKEKNLQVEGVINFLKIYFDLLNFYLNFIKGLRIEFDTEYFVSIFGETERLNNEYKLEVLKLKEELKESYEANKLSKQDIAQYKSLISLKDIELLNLDEQNKQLQAQIIVLKDIKLNSMEEKLNKTIDMLNELQDYLVESRAATSCVVRLINGKTLSEDDLKAERVRMEALKNERR